MATTWGRKIFCEKGYKKVILNGYYLRKEILKKVAVFCRSRWLLLEEGIFEKETLWKNVCSKWALENQWAKSQNEKAKLLADKVGWVAEAHPTLPE